MIFRGSWDLSNTADVCRFNVAMVESEIHVTRDDDLIVTVPNDKPSADTMTDEPFWARMVAGAQKRTTEPPSAVNCPEKAQPDPNDRDALFDTVAEATAAVSPASIATPTEPANTSKTFNELLPMNRMPKSSRAVPAAKTIRLTV